MPTKTKTKTPSIRCTVCRVECIPSHKSYTGDSKFCSEECVNEYYTNKINPKNILICN